MSIASTGRTLDCTRPACIHLKTILAKREPSAHDPQQILQAHLSGPSPLGLCEIVPAYRGYWALDRAADDGSPSSANDSSPAAICSGEPVSGLTGSGNMLGGTSPRPDGSTMMATLRSISAGSRSTPRAGGVDDLHAVQALGWRCLPRWIAPHSTSAHVARRCAAFFCRWIRSATADPRDADLGDTVRSRAPCSKRLRNRFRRRAAESE